MCSLLIKDFFKVQKQVLNCIGKLSYPALKYDIKKGVYKCVKKQKKHCVTYNAKSG